MIIAFSPYTVINNKCCINSQSNNISFNGWQNVKKVNSAFSDVFENSQNVIDKKYYLSVKKIMRKAERELKAFTPQKLENAVTDVKKVHQDISEEEILTVMQRLTQWANYSSFERLGYEFDRLNIYEMQKNNTPLSNKCLQYFIANKDIINNKLSNQKKGYWVLKDELNQFYNIDKKNVYFVLEGFDDGVNFFSDDNLLAQKTSKILFKIKDLTTKNPSLNFDDALSFALNGEISKFFADKDVKVNFIRNKGSATRDTILKQMSPVMPNSPEEIMNIIDLFITKLRPKNLSSAVKLRDNIVNYFNSNIQFYSKQSLVEFLKDIKVKISKFAKKHDIPEENILYIIPCSQKHSVKSFGVITEMYARANDIPYEKILQIADFPLAENQKSLFVILDDVAVSGDSLISANNYTYASKRFNDNTHVLFCPLISNKSGFSNIRDAIFSCKREKFDGVISSNLISEKSKLNLNNKLLKMYFTLTKLGQDALGYSGFCNKFGQKSIVLPYMTPDNNPELSTILTHLFIPNQKTKSSSAIKNPHQLLSEIIYQNNL